MDGQMEDVELVHGWAYARSRAYRKKGNWYVDESRPWGLVVFTTAPLGSEQEATKLNAAVRQHYVDQGTPYCEWDENR